MHIGTHAVGNAWISFDTLYTNKGQNGNAFIGTPLDPSNRSLISGIRR